MFILENIHDSVSLPSILVQNAIGIYFIVKRALGGVPCEFVAFSLT